MKQIKKSIIATTLSIMMLTSCGATVLTESEEKGESDVSMFIVVENTTNWKIVYNRETKVMYAVSRGQYNNGTFTLLVNADGTPMLWED